MAIIKKPDMGQLDLLGGVVEEPVVEKATKTTKKNVKKVVEEVTPVEDTDVMETMKEEVVSTDATKKDTEDEKVYDPKEDEVVEDTKDTESDKVESDDDKDTTEDEEEIKVVKTDYSEDGRYKIIYKEVPAKAPTTRDIVTQRELTFDDTINNVDNAIDTIIEGRLYSMSRDYNKKKINKKPTLDSINTVSVDDFIEGLQMVVSGNPDFPSISEDISKRELKDLYLLIFDLLNEISSKHGIRVGNSFTRKFVASRVNHLKRYNEKYKGGKILLNSPYIKVTHENKFYMHDYDDDREGLLKYFSEDEYRKYVEVYEDENGNLVGVKSGRVYDNAESKRIRSKYVNLPGVNNSNHLQRYRNALQKQNKKENGDNK